MSNKKILYIDMDDTVADFSKAIKPLLAPYSHLNEQETYDKVDEILPQHPEFFHDLEPMPNSIETVKKLSEFYDIYFLSTPMWIMPESFTGKRIWIEKHFGELAVKRLILTHRKDLNVGDYLIDDRTHNGAGEFTGEHIHFGTEKFPDWNSVYDYLMKPTELHKLPPYKTATLNIESWIKNLEGYYTNNKTFTFE